MRGLSRRAGRLGDDGAQPDRDDQLRGCGFPDLHALWSCFLRAYDALCIVGETTILAHRTSTAAGSETTQARDPIPSSHEQNHRPSTRLPTYRIRSTQLHRSQIRCSRIRSIGVRRSRTRYSQIRSSGFRRSRTCCSQLRWSRIRCTRPRNTRTRESWPRRPPHPVLRRSARPSPHRGHLRQYPNGSSRACAEQAAADRALARIIRILFRPTLCPTSD